MKDHVEVTKMRIKYITVILCVLFLSVPFILSPSVLAAVGMTPTEGAVGTDVSISGLLPGSSYVIKWDGDDYKTGTVPTGGSVSFTLAETYGGSHTVSVQNPVGTQVFSGTFNILPTITIDPTSGFVDTSVTVEGLGFASAETKIKILYDDTAAKTGITADDNGSWTTTFKVPASTSGTHLVDASGDTTEEGDVVDKTFTTSPKITVKPVTGGVGTAVAVSGTAFDSAESNIKVLYDNKEMRTGIIADVHGSWSTSFKIPSSTKGTHVIDAQGETTDDDDVDDINFAVLPGISVTETEGYVGDEVDVTGTGFANNENSIKVTFDGKVVGSDIDADDDGNWSASITIPDAQYGSHLIDAYGNTTVSADVLDSSFAVEPIILLRPKEGNVGTTIYIEGTGFSSKKDYVVNYGENTVSSSLTTDSNGSFSTSFPAPKSASGNIKITATDIDGISGSAVFSMETTPPPVPRIAAPKDGGRVGYIGDMKVTFDWTDVTDPSGVHYELEISTQSNFTTTVLRIADLKDSKYTLTEAEALSHGEYYWRVRAIDDAGNTSDWTPLSVVKVGFITLKALIIIICAIVGFIILVTLVPWIVRKIIRMKATV
jgi:hypothetical protein